MRAQQFALTSACFHLVITFGLAARFASGDMSPAAQHGIEERSTTSSQQTGTSEKTASMAEDASKSVRRDPSPPESDASDCQNLAKDYPLRLKLNGKRLPLDYARLQQGDEKYLLSEARVRPLSDGRLIIGLGESLYMLETNRHIQWTYTVPQIVRDFAVVESTGLVYGTAGDNFMFILDGSTGRELYGNSRNGKAAYGQVVPFGRDMCLITDDFWGYRLDEWEICKIDTLMQDGITAWRGTEALWNLPFPPDAELVVSGDRIFAVTRTDKSIYVREILPPKTDSSQ